MSASLVMSSRKQLSQANYSRFEFDEETENNLFAYCRANSLGLRQTEGTTALAPSDFKFHVTIVYSSVMHPSFVDEAFEIEPFELVPKCFQLFGSHKPRVALEFQLNEKLDDYFAHYQVTYGHQPDYETFRPHLTVRGTTGATEDVIRSLALPLFPIRACRIVHEVRQSPNGHLVQLSG